MGTKGGELTKATDEATIASALTRIRRQKMTCRSNEPKTAMQRKIIWFTPSERLSFEKSAIDAISESDIAGITVICYYSSQSNFCAMQAFAYEEFVYKPQTPMIVKA